LLKIRCGEGNFVHMKKSSYISKNVIRRLPRYLRKLDELIAAGVERISSSELGTQMGLTPSQIRQDFSCFGEFGQQGYGYNIVALREQVAQILGMNRNYSVILIGAGRIGQSLIENFNFNRYGNCLFANSLTYFPIFQRRSWILRRIIHHN